MIFRNHTIDGFVEAELEVAESQSKVGLRLLDLLVLGRVFGMTFLKWVLDQEQLF